MLLPNTPIPTTNKIISVKGKVFYNDRRRRIDLKRPIRDLFESGNLDVSYVMELCLSQNKLLERINELADKDVMPVILYFTKNDKYMP